jgi:hypothetical protein
VAMLVPASSASEAAKPSSLIRPVPAIMLSPFFRL